MVSSRADLFPSFGGTFGVTTLVLDVMSLPTWEPFYYVEPSYWGPGQPVPTP